MHFSWTTIALLVCSNVFMTFAWYGPLSKMKGTTPIWLLILISWAIALFEYVFMVPANRVGRNAGMTLNQLKIIQEVVSLTIFLPVSILFLDNRLNWNYVLAAACIIGAVYFIYFGPFPGTPAGGEGVS